MGGSTIAEYLVRLGAEVDTNSFREAEGALQKLSNLAGTMKKGAILTGIAAAFVTLGQAAISCIRDTAKADMEFTRLAQSMWITKDSAKSLKTAMDIMGVSEEDIAWVPELREQFFRLRGEMNALATPKDADSQLAWIRDIGYDIQSLMVKLKALKEWVTYYLIKYLSPHIQEFRKWINWLNDKIGKNMPQIAKTIAKFLSIILGIGSSVIRVVKDITGAIYEFVDRLPRNVKKWVAVFAAVGAIIMSGPFGLMIAAIGGALLLIQDLVYYMNGWNSSETLAPVWKTLLSFINGDTMSGVMNTLNEGLTSIANTLDLIITSLNEGIDWSGLFEMLKENITWLISGVDDLWNSVQDLFGEIKKATGLGEQNRQKSFWRTIGEAISDNLKRIMNLAGAIGKLFSAIALAMRGEWKRAASMLYESGASLFKSHPTGALVNSIAGEENSTRIMDKLVSNGGLSVEGAAVVAGHASKEGLLSASTVEADKGFTNEQYLTAINNGTHDFINDGIGFGLFQWTYPDRKRALWEYAKATGRAINDEDMQIEFFLKELRESFPEVYEALKSGDMQWANYLMLTQYERPQVQDSAEESDRLGRANRAYSKYQEDKKPVLERVKDKLSGILPGGDNTGSTSSFVSKGSGPTYASSFAASPSTYVYGGNLLPASNVVTFGDINVNVAKTNATAEDIAQSIRKGMDARFNRGVFA